MKTTTIKKWFKRISLSVVILTGITYFYIDYQLSQMYGGHTQVVNAEQFQIPQASLAFINATVLAEDGLHMLTEQTVVIDAGMIIAVGHDVQIPTNAKIIDAQGKYLIPGLIDSHVHLVESPNDLLLYVANGITQVREMMGNKLHLKWREEIKNGRIGPKLFVATAKLETSSTLAGWFNHWTRKDININSTAKAQKILQDSKEQGFDAVKLGSLFAIQHYREVSESSKNVDIPIIGHITLEGRLSDLFKGNQKEVAHIEELTKLLDLEFGGYSSKNADEFLAFVQQRSDEVALQLVKHNIAVISTLHLMETFVRQKHELDTILAEIQLPYANPGITEGTPLTSRGLGWIGKVNRYRLNDDYPKNRLEGNKIYWNTYVKAQKIMLKKMLQHNAIILVGTDANAPVMVPGFSLHEEFVTLSQSGMKNAQILQSSTAIPAQWMQQKSGIIKQGYRADLVLLNKNPLSNIENTKSINTVILNGKVLNRQKLDAMLAAVKNANDESRSVDISNL